MAPYLFIVAAIFLSGCLPDEKDPEQSSEAGRLSGSYYAAALGNLAVHIQNSVVSDPSWFNAVTASQLDIAALGVNPNIMGARFRSHVCPTGTGTEVVQVTWVDGRDSSNKFAVRGIGSNTGVMMGELRKRVSSEQLGVYDGSSRLTGASAVPITIPSSCSDVSIPVGAPVLVFRIQRPASPLQEMARTEYRTQPCPEDILPDGTTHRQLGTLVQSRIIRYTAEGRITPSDPNAGWGTESLGNCVPDTVVTAESTTNDTGGSVALNNFADLAANNFKAILQQQLEMKCADSNITGYVAKRDANGHIMKDANGKAIYEDKSKGFDTCSKATALAASSQVTERNTGDGVDTRDLCEDGTRTQSKSLLGISTGTYTATTSGTIFVDRTLDNRIVTAHSTGQTGERARWVGRVAPMGCARNETYVATCGRVPGAPHRSQDFNAAPNKWTVDSLTGYLIKESWFDSIFLNCWFNCTKFLGGSIHTLNWDYFNSRNTLHSDMSTTRAVGGWNTNSWQDRFTDFSVKFVQQPWNVPSASNQCRVRHKEIQLNCPLAFDPLRVAAWSPYKIDRVFQTTLIPGGSYGGPAGQTYSASRSKGDTPGWVSMSFKTCNIKSCDTWTETAGPGTSSYIKSWRYSDRSSYSGASTAVQTVMLDTEPQIYDLVPGIASGPNLVFKDRAYIRGLHCGRLESRNYSIWPTLRYYYYSCGNRKRPRTCLGAQWGTTTVTEIVRREWYGDNAVSGTWSRPKVEYDTNGYGIYGSVGAIPNPIILW